MSEKQENNRRRDWQDCLPWLILFKAVRPAIGLRVLVLASIGLVGMVAGWRICWDLFAYTENGPEVKVIAPELGDLGAQNKGPMPPWPWEADYRDFGVRSPLRGLSTLPVIGPVLGTATRTASELTLPFQILFRQGLTYRSFAYAVCCCGWALLIWGYFGGMITRIAALKLTRDELVTCKEAGTFTRSRWCSYMTAPLLPILGIFALGVPIALLGFFSNLDIGLLVSGILWPLVIGIGFLMTLFLLGLVFGWPLMWSTISTEGTDAFDAISRAYAYVFQRPFHYLFYVIVATLVGALGWVLIHGVVDLVVYITTHWAFCWWMPAERFIDISAAGGLDSGPGKIGHNLIWFWQAVLRTFSIAFAISFLWTSGTAIYLLLRRQVDGVELDEACLEDGDTKFGLPNLETDASGSVGVAGSENSPE